MCCPSDIRLSAAVVRVIETRASRKVRRVWVAELRHEGTFRGSRWPPGPGHCMVTGTHGDELGNNRCECKFVHMKVFLMAWNSFTLSSPQYVWNPEVRVTSIKTYRSLEIDSALFVCFSFYDPPPFQFSWANFVNTILSLPIHWKLSWKMQKVPDNNVTVTRIMCLTRGLALPPPSASLWYFTLILFPRMRILFNFVWLYYSPTARAGENSRGDWSELSNVNGHFETCTFKRTSKPYSAMYALHRHFIVWWAGDIWSGRTKHIVIIGEPLHFWFQNWCHMLLPLFHHNGLIIYQPLPQHGLIDAVIQKQ